jgi:hypothetical protein
MNIDTFNENFLVIISRYELYPAIEPTNYVVGFTVTCNVNNMTYYIDTVVDRNISKCEKEISKIAWNKVKDAIYDWANSVCHKCSLLNSKFVPEE